MKYAVVQCVNGSFKVVAESDNLNTVIVNYHGTCQNLWNAPDVITGSVSIINENMEIEGGFKETINHPVSAPTTPTEPTEC